MKNILVLIDKSIYDTIKPLIDTFKKYLLENNYYIEGLFYDDKDLNIYKHFLNKDVVVIFTNNKTSFSNLFKFDKNELINHPKFILIQIGESSISLDYKMNRLLFKNICFKYSLNNTEDIVFGNIKNKDSITQEYLDKIVEVGKLFNED